MQNHIQFSDESSMLLDSARSFCRDQWPIARVREQLGASEALPASDWQQMADLGWLGLAVPERYGGSGFGLGAAAVISECMGRQLVSGPFLATQMLIQGLLCSANEAHKQLWLPQLASGAIGAVALLEPHGSWRTEDITARAEPDGDTWRLSGVKSFVTDWPQADLTLIALKVGGEPALLPLTREELRSVQARRETVVDETRRSFELRLDGVSLAHTEFEARCLRGEAAARAFTLMQRCGLLLTAAESAGGSAGALAVTVEYLNNRTAFGRKIGSYQGLKHPCADILVGLERSRSHVYHAATLMDEGSDPDVALAMAKAEAGETFVFAGDRAVQFHGGFGFTYDCDAQLYLRRALWCQYAFGDAAFHRAYLTEKIL